MSKDDTGPAQTFVPPTALAVRSDAALGAFDPFADAAPAAAAVSSAAVPTLARLAHFKWTMLATFALVAGVAISAIWTLTVPEYRARATLEVAPSNPRVLYRTEDNGILPGHQQFMNSQPGVMRGVTVLRRVLEQPAVQATQWYQTPRKTLSGKPISRLEALKDALLVEPRPNTYLIDVSMSTRDPREAETICNAVVDEYLEFTREKLEETNDAVYQRLTRWRGELAGAVDERKSVTSKLARSLGSSTANDVVSQRRALLEDRQSRLEELRREIETAEWQEHELAALVEAPVHGDSAAAAPGSALQPRYQDDAEWRRLHIELKTVRHQSETNTQGLGPNHPDMVALRKKAELLQDLLSEQEKRLEAQWAACDGKAPIVAGAVSPAGELAALRRQIGKLHKQEELLAQEVERRRDEFTVTFANAEELTREASLLRYDEEKLDLVRRRMDEKETESGMFVLVRPVATAFAPSQPDQDRRVLFSIAALVAAAAAAIGAAYTRATLNSAIHRSTELAGTVQTPFLGTIPFLQGADRPDSRAAAMQHESMRMVRTALMQRLEGQPGGAVLVTSAGPSVGKTTVACLLARSLAECGKRVLLVDADLRNPSVAQRMNIAPRPGLLDCLRGQRAEQDVIVGMDTPNLSVMPAGTVNGIGDPELLANGAFGACLERWRKRFDVVLLDSPPVLPVADARILARQVAGTVLVAREWHCRREDLVEALASLGVSGARMLGTVFLGAGSRTGYRYEYYGRTLSGSQEAIVSVDAREVR